MNDRAFDFINALTVLSFALQMMNYQELQTQATTDDIIQEIQKQKQMYLEEILKNQKQILDKLAELSG